jgi:hypothetical protein
MMRFLACIAASLLLHLLLLLINISFDHTPPKNKPVRVSLVTVPKANPKIEVKDKKKKEVVKKKKEKKEEELPDKQIVDLPPDPSSERPEDARFASESNHKVEKESISRNRTLTPEKAGHEVMKGADDKSGKSLGTEQADQEEQVKNELPRIDQRDRLKVAESEDGELRNDSGSHELRGDGESLHLGNADKNAKRSKKGDKKINLFPKDVIEEAARRSASAPFADHVEDVDEGEGTFLNTFETKYATFFNRVKRQIAQHWNPWPEYRRRDPTGNVYGIRTRKTIVAVVLDSKGYVVSATVKHSCGADFLDKIAVRSFLVVGQFPNPPKGAIKDGKVKFDFGFIITRN